MVAHWEYDETAKPPAYDQVEGALELELDRARVILKNDLAKPTGLEYVELASVYQHVCQEVAGHAANLKIINDRIQRRLEGE